MTLASNNTPIHRAGTEDGGANDFSSINQNNGAILPARQGEMPSESEVHRDGSRENERSTSTHGAPGKENGTAMELDE